MNKRISMTCPRCVQKVAPDGASCPHCGFSLEAACALYGREAVIAGPLMDVEERLGAAEAGMVREVLAAFERAWPQFFLLVYLGPLPVPSSPRQFAFWLLNHAAVALPDPERMPPPNERGFLLVMDPEGGAAVLSAGYYAERLIRQAELDQVLKSAVKALGKADFAAAAVTVAGGLGTLLRRKMREFIRHPARFQEKPLQTGGESGPAAFPPLIRTGEVTPVREEPAVAEPTLPVLKITLDHLTAPAPAAAAGPSKSRGKKKEKGREPASPSRPEEAAPRSAVESVRKRIRAAGARKSKPRRS